MSIDNVSKVSLACLPTPFHELSNLSKELGGPRIFVKRDDLTGLGFGGNKVRKIEYLMDEVIRTGCDYIITGAFVQSNWCTAAAAAARRLGLGVVLVKEGPENLGPEEAQGNHLLHLMLGAEVHIVGPGRAETKKAEIAEDLCKKGHRPCVLAVGGSDSLGSYAYIEAVREVVEQAAAIGISPNYLVHASGSGGTQAGTVIGAKLYGNNLKVVCSSTGSRPKSDGEALVRRLIAETTQRFNIAISLSDDDVTIHDQYAGGYGHVTKPKLEAIDLLARTEGLFLDPVYSGSGMACLIDMVRSGAFEQDSVVVFMHTGGQAGIFPYANPLHAAANGKEPSWTIPPWHAH